MGGEEEKNRGDGDYKTDPMNFLSKFSGAPVTFQAEASEWPNEESAEARPNRVICGWPKNTESPPRVS